MSSLFVSSRLLFKISDTYFYFRNLYFVDHPIKLQIIENPVI